MKEKRDYLHQDFSLDNKTINTKKVNNTQLTISNTTKIILRKLVKLSQSSNKYYFPIVGMFYRLEADYLQ